MADLLKTRIRIFDNTLRYSVPLALVGISAYLTVYYQLSLILNILIPLSVFLVFTQLLILLEVKKSRGHIQETGVNPYYFSSYRFKGHRQRYSDIEELEKWDYLLYESIESSIVFDFIYEMEDIKGLRLSEPARQMILIPIIENVQKTGEFNQDLIRESLNSLFNTIQEDPATLDKEYNKIRTSQSVVKSFWKNFCNIPPFCSQKDRDNVR